jgi:hypothetical protein
VANFEKKYVSANISCLIFLKERAIRSNLCIFFSSLTNRNTYHDFYVSIFFDFLIPLTKTKNKKIFRLIQLVRERH